MDRSIDLFAIFLLAVALIGLNFLIDLIRETFRPSKYKVVSYLDREGNVVHEYEKE
jgi:hypothetical protein